MKIERTKNAKRNVIFGFALKIYSIILPFIMRTAMIYWLGIEYLGLNSLFTSILQVLNLAELGVGSAMTFSMYKPIAEDDEAKICALMRLYRLYYRFIGCIVCIGGLIILPFLPKLISGHVPDGINIYILYLFNLSATVLTYWLFAYRNSIFEAYQRTDIVSKVTITTDTVKYALQIFVLAVFHDYYLYVIIVLVTQIINNITIAIISKKMYPNYSPVGNLSENERKSINKRITDLFTSKLGGTIITSADTIVISTYLGLRQLAIYQNYYYILNALSGIVLIVFSSVTAGSGNSMVTESKKKNYYDFRKLSWLSYWLIGYSVCGMMCLYQTFMKLWVGSDMMLTNEFPVLFCLYFFGNMTIQLLSVYKNAAGIWHQDRFRPLISGIVNLIINIILVQFYELDGVLLSTIISIFCVSLPWLLHNVFTYIFKGYLEEYLSDMCKYAAAIIIGTTLSKYVCDLIRDGGFIVLIIKTIVCTIIYNIFYLLLFFKTKIFMDSIKKIL